MGVRTDDLWRCPRCGRRFVTPSMWHSCEVHTVEEHLARVPPAIAEVYRGYEAMARSCGDDVEVVAQRSRIAFMVRVRHAGAVLQQRSVRASFALRRRLDSPRVVRIDEYGNGWVGHVVKLACLDDLDDELQAWLCESYELGCQRG